MRAQSQRVECSPRSCPKKRLNLFSKGVESCISEPGVSAAAAELKPLAESCMKDGLSRLAHITIGLCWRSMLLRAMLIGMRGAAMLRSILLDPSLSISVKFNFNH